MAQNSDNDPLKEALMDLVAHQITPTSAFRLVQLVTDESPLKGMATSQLTKLAERIAADSPNELLVSTDGKLKLYSVAARMMPRGSGSRLERRFKEIEPGANGATTFEEWCTETLNLLFRETLQFLPPQAVAQSGDGRLDYCASIISGNRFWDRLQADYNSRYVVFEFKNSEKSPIKEDVRQAARYLSGHANRMVAVLICRNSMDKNAFAEADITLKEGKLILIVTAHDLISMVHGKEIGKDPTELMLQKLHLFLMESSR